MERVADGLEEIALVAVADQVGEHFGVGLGVEMMALALEPGAEGAVVFDDAVVDERDVAGLVEMRVGVDLGRRAVGGPAGVGDAGGGALEKRSAGQSARAWSLSAATLPGDLETTIAVVIEDGDARRVIAAVFEAAQAVDEHAWRIRFSDVSDDSAHDDLRLEI